MVFTPQFGPRNLKVCKSSWKIFFRQIPEPRFTFVSMEREVEKSLLRSNFELTVQLLLCRLHCKWCCTYKYLLYHSSYLFILIWESGLICWSAPVLPFPFLLIRTICEFELKFHLEILNHFGFPYFAMIWTFPSQVTDKFSSIVETALW